MVRSTFRNTSLKLASGVAIALVGILAIAGSWLLIWLTSEISDATGELVRDGESVALVDGIELRLLTHNRVGNLRALGFRGEREGVRTRLETEIQQLFGAAQEYTAAGSEGALLQVARRQTRRYLVQRASAERRGVAFQQLVEESRESLEDALDTLRTLRELNRAQMRAARERAERLNRLADILGLVFSAVFVLGLLGLGLAVRRYVVSPLWELRQAIGRYRAGDRNVTLVERGALEVREISRAFNEMRLSLQRQREDQLAFLSGVAHDLRNPLGAFRLGLDSLDDEPEMPAPERRRIVALLRRQTDRLGRMLGDLLDATRIEAGQLDLHPERLDLRAAAREIVDLYEPTSPDHEVRLRVPPEPLWIRGDGLRVEQVISNLVSNAIKYSPRGSAVDVIVRDDGTQALLDVMDRGAGVPPEQVDEIFRPFRRRTETQDVAPGVGLGLSVVRRIVDAHGGRIEVHSVVGEGSTFRVCWPRDPAASEASSPEPGADPVRPEPAW